MAQPGASLKVMRRFFSFNFGLFGRLLFSWRFLKITLWTVTLIVLFYAEEDWRGARAWAATKAKWEAKGETFDYAKLIPPPIPDDQNLAAIPLFKLEPQRDFEGNPYLAPLILRKALRKDLDNMHVTFSMAAGDWQHGVLPDVEEIQRKLASYYKVILKESPSSSDPMVQLDDLYPFLSDLHAAAARPFCRFPVVGSVTFSSSRWLELLTSQLGISKILTLHAILALSRDRSDLALDDIRINFKLMSGVA